MNNRHPHYDTIVAWAEGKTIQVWCSESSAWYDWALSDAAPAPCFYRDNEYRVKPKTVRYRTFLRKSISGVPYVEITTETENKEAPREQWPQFVRWLGDWQEVEI